jgi:hypothetical protein
MTLRSTTCPRCGLTSWHPVDVREGFCGNCHGWTSRPDLDDPKGHPMTEQQHPDPAWWKRYDPDDLAVIDGPATVTHEAWEIAGAQFVDRSPLDELRALLDVPPLTAAQAQGDVFVLPWLETTTPQIRVERADAATEIDPAGCAVTDDGSHLLLPNTMADRPGVRYAHVGRGNTLGTLVVDAGHAARLSHREHGDLLIGPGVYVLHRQRRWQSPAHSAPVVD